MKEIIVKCQEDFDSIKDASVPITIKVVFGHIVVEEIPVNCHLCLFDSSRAVLLGSSSSVLHDSSSAALCGSSSAVLYNSSSADLWGSSSAVLYNSSSAALCGSSSAVLHDSSRAVLHDSSRATLFDSSSAVLWGSSEAICYMVSVARVRSGNASIQAFDDVTIFEHERPRSITKTDLVSLVCPLSDPKFDEWIERGWIVADEIRVKYVSHKQVGGAVLYEGETFDKRDIFVARAGEKFAHGDTPEKAVSDLRFKIADRDTSRFKNLAMDKRYPVEDLIEAYRVITGACETGVKMFCEKIKLNEEYTVKEVLELTKDQYGHSEFRNFFGVKQ